mgnify:FL=1
MNHNVIETVLGAVVLVVAAIFLTMALGAADARSVGGYPINANFSKVDGINPGIDVRISGVKVGSVTAMTLDPNTYLAHVTMNIKDDVKLPVDTVAKIASEGLLGGKYMALEPGAEEEMMKPGAQIQYTQASLNLEEMIGKFIFSAADKDKKDKKDEAAPAAKAEDPFADDGAE